MKNLLSILALSILAASPLKAAAEYDLLKGVDLTATNYVTTSLLNQLVDAGRIGSTNKGGVIRRSGGGGTYWPDVTLNSRYTNFVWLDTYTTPGTLKQYVCCGDVYTNWVASTVTPNSITAAEILNYTITEPKMATNSVNQYALQDSAVTANKIAGNSIIAGKLGPASVILGNYAFGSIRGGDITNNTITVTNLADGAVTRDKLGATVVDNTRLTNDAVFTANITNGAVTGAKIAASTVESNNIASSTINKANLDTTVSRTVPLVWGFIDGTSILNGTNIASVVNPTTGIYTINFSSALPGTNYVVVATALYRSTTTFRNVCYYSNSVSQVWIDTRNETGAGVAGPLSITIFGY